jgi:hypothetical protein
MVDQWYFEIGDGQTYGPFTLEKLQKWAEAGNLMPTHRVRNAESTEWVIAAYVPGLELTTVVMDAEANADSDATRASGKSLGKLVRGFGRQKKRDSDTSSEAGMVAREKNRAPAEPPDIVALYAPQAAQVAAWA